VSLFLYFSFSVDFFSSFLFLRKRVPDRDNNNNNNNIIIIIIIIIIALHFIAQ